MIKADLNISLKTYKIIFETGKAGGNNPPAISLDLK
jgi:hypothetical protein